MNKIYLSFLLCLVATAMLRAEVKPHALFSDGAVLQRDCDVPVWGRAGDGEKVTVKFAGQAVSAVASNGQWMVRLRPMLANLHRAESLAGPEGPGHAQRQGERNCGRGPIVPEDRAERNDGSSSS